jgi:hypothetical protein
MNATTARPGPDGQAHTDRPAEPSVTHLVSGIVGDLQDLVRHQVALFKAELSSDLRKSRQVAVMMSVGIAVLSVGGLVLAFTVVHWLQLATGWHLSTCEAVVGGVLTVVGVALLLAGKSKLESFSLIPDQSIQALKETVECVTNRN